MSERTLEQAMAHAQGDHGDCVPACEDGFCQESDEMAALLADEILRLQAGLSNERREAWESVKSMIVMGELQGNGCDKSAERNGIIMASNKLAERIHQ